MNKRFAIVALLLPVIALAQHQHAPPVVVTPETDPDRRSVPHVVVPKPGESHDHASMHALPIGGGAAPDGGAWLRIDVPGAYCVHNAEVLEFPNGCPMQMEGNRLYRVMPHPGALLWTPPGGAKGEVPSTQLIAPGPTAKRRVLK